MKYRTISLAGQVLGLLAALVTLVAALLAMRTPAPPPTSALTLPPPAGAHVLTVTAASPPVMSTKAPTLVTRVWPEPDPPAPEPAVRVIGSGASLPDAAEAARDITRILGKPGVAVRGSLQCHQLPPDPTIGGMITTHMTADVDVDDGTNRPLHLSVRGAGFSPEASALHARTRLQEALREHVKDE